MDGLIRQFIDLQAHRTFAYPSMRIYRSRRVRTFAFASGHEGMTLAEQDKHAAAVADAKRLPRIALVESGPETTVEYHLYLRCINTTETDVFGI